MVQVLFLARLRRLAIVLAVASFFPQPAHAEPLRIASLAPSESAFGQLLLSMASEITQATRGEVTLKLFLGGRLGDEGAVRARLGKGIDGAYFTGVGMGLVLPAYRVVELPFLAETASEADRLRAALGPGLTRSFADHTELVLLALGESGPVHVYSKKPIADLKTLRTIKLAVWKGDQLSLETWRALGVEAHPMELFEILPGLESGRVDAVATTPAGALVFGWSSAVGFVSEHPIATAGGGLVITKAALEKIPEAHRAEVKAIALRYGQRIIDQVKKDNDAARALLVGKGRLVTTPIKDIDALKAAAKGTWAGLAERMGAKAELAEAARAVGKGP